MLRRLALSLGLTALTAAGPLLAQRTPPVEHWIPDEAVLTVELARPQVVFDLLRDEAVLEFITGLPAWEEWTRSKDFGELRNLVRYLETMLEVDWRTGLERLTGGGLTLAAGPQGEVLLIVEARDEELLAHLHEFAVDIARSQAGRAGGVTSERRGPAEVWSFNGKEAHAIVGNRFLVSNRRGALDAALELVEGTGKGSLATTASYREAREAARADAVVRFYADLVALKENPKLASALSGARSNPMAALLFADLTEALRGSSFLSATLAVEGPKLTLCVDVDGQAAGAESAAAFAVPAAGAGPLPNLDVPGRIGAATFHRDLHRFYAAKDELFPERSSSLIFFENMMGIFFTGRDLTDEVFAATRPDVRLLVAEQRYDAEIGTPEVQIPAFAAVIGLRDVAADGEVFEEAWQKALGLFNFTRGQKALPGLIIRSATRGDTDYTVAYFSARGIEDRTKLHERYNFRPTLAMPGDFLVLSSSEGLARDLIDALGRERAGSGAPLAGVGGVLEIDGGRLAAILEENLDSLVRSNMVNEGNTREAAQAEIGVLLTIARLVDSVSLSVGTDGTGTRALLEAQLNPPTRTPGGSR